jgi:hypothetical protein
MKYFIHHNVDEQGPPALRSALTGTVSVDWLLKVGTFVVLDLERSV